MLEAAEIAGKLLSDGYCRAAWNAVCRSQAVIEFDMSGVITWANKHFLELVGYQLRQLVGQHHRILCTNEFAASSSYAAFGIGSVAASSKRASSHGSGRTAARSGCRRPTIRSSMKEVRCSGY